MVTLCPSLFLDNYGFSSLQAHLHDDENVSLGYWVTKENFIMFIKPASLM